MSGIALTRLIQERKRWRRDHPVGFFARPQTNSDGSLDLFRWTAGISGKAGTPWEGGVYRMSLQFTEDYPSRPPKCKFDAGFFHPNIFPSGTVCLDIINEEQRWKPSTTLKQILLAISELLVNPNTNSPAQRPAYELILRDPEAYDQRISQQAKLYVPKQEKGTE